MVITPWAHIITARQQEAKQEEEKAAKARAQKDSKEAAAKEADKSKGDGKGKSVGWRTSIAHPANAFLGMTVTRRPTWNTGDL